MLNRIISASISRGISQNLSFCDRSINFEIGQNLISLSQHQQPSHRYFSQNTIIDDKNDINIDQVAYGFMASQALFSALEIGVFDHIAAAKDKNEDGLHIQELNELCQITAPRLQTLLTSLVSMNSLYRDEKSGKYTLSPNTSQFLVQSSRYYYGDYLRYQIGRQFYGRMGDLTQVLTTGQAPNYAEWFANPETANTYTKAQHNGSVATAKGLVKKLKFLSPDNNHDEQQMELLDVGGGSGAFSYVLAKANDQLNSTILELPKVIASANQIKSEQPLNIQNRVNFVELDVNSNSWPTPENNYDIVLMSYISGSVPESSLSSLYSHAFAALKTGGRLIVHDFMVDDTLDGPPIAALWALQHVTVNAEGLGLSPANVLEKLELGGFDTSKCEVSEMIHGLTKLVVAQK